MAIIVFQCENAACHRTIKLKEDLAGKRIKCPACGQKLVVPLQSPATKPAAEGPVPMAEVSILAAKPTFAPEGAQPVADAPLSIQTAIRNPESASEAAAPVPEASPSPQSAIRNPQSASEAAAPAPYIRPNPQSAIRNPQFALEPNETGAKPTWSGVQTAPEPIRAKRLPYGLFCPKCTALLLPPADFSGRIVCHHCGQNLELV